MCTPKRERGAEGGGDLGHVLATLLYSVSSLGPLARPLVGKHALQVQGTEGVKRGRKTTKLPCLPPSTYPYLRKQLDLLL